MEGGRRKEERGEGTECFMHIDYKKGIRGWIDR